MDIMRTAFQKYAHGIKSIQDNSSVAGASRRAQGSREAKIGIESSDPLLSPPTMSSESSAQRRVSVLQAHLLTPTTSVQVNANSFFMNDRVHGAVAYFQTCIPFHHPAVLFVSLRLLPRQSPPMLTTVRTAHHFSEETRNIWVHV